MVRPPRPSSAPRPSSSSSRLLQLANDDSNNDLIDDNINERNDDNNEEVDDDDDVEHFRDPPVGYIRLRPSKFACIPATVYVEYPQDLGLRRQDQEEGELVELGNKKLSYKSLWERICIRNAFKRAGFKKSEKTWTVMWSKHQNDSQMSDLNCLQKINHFPSSWCVGRKDRLARTMESMHRIKPQEFNFHPESFILPLQREALHRKIFMEIETAKKNLSIKKINDHRLDRASMWIMKPCASSCGRGIKVITGQKALLLPKNKPVLLQKYLHDPYLIDGKKFDLRIYVLVTGVDPLRVYVHNEGLTRISTCDYSLKNIKNRFAHLTNYSINKKSDKFKAATYIDDDSDDDNESDNDLVNDINNMDINDKDKNSNSNNKGSTNIHAEREGFKWSIAAFKRWLSEKESPEIMKKTFEKINDLCCKTMIAAESEITAKLYTSANYRSNCFELFGCDVILDADLNPHLLEVNVSPSLVGSSPLDRKIKGTLIADILHTVGTYPHDPKLLAKYDNPSTQSKSNDNMNPFAFSSLSKMMESQDLWRKSPHPSSVNFAGLGSNESAWLLLLMAEDEFSRAATTQFTRVHPTTEKAEHYVSLYKSSRFADHLLAKWVIESGSIGPLRKFVPSKFWRKNPLNLSCPWAKQTGGTGKKMVTKQISNTTPNISPSINRKKSYDNSLEDTDIHSKEIIFSHSEIKKHFNPNRNPHIVMDRRINEDSSLPLFTSTIQKGISINNDATQARQTSQMLREYREKRQVTEIVTTNIRNRPRSSGVYKGHSYSRNSNNNHIENINNNEPLYKYDDQRSRSLPPLNRDKASGNNSEIQKQRKLSKIIL